jgi:putative adenylate-forming enzyme
MNIQMMLRLLSKLGRLRQRDRWTRAQIEAHQDEALRRLRNDAYQRSPFYRRFHARLENRPLSELPVLTKATLMEHFDELVTDPTVRLDAVRTYLADSTDYHRFLGRYWVSATSGSTGRPGLFLFNQEEWLAVLASFARAHDWAGLEVSLTHRMKMASVASIAPSHMSAQVAATLQSWWMPALRLAASEPVETLVERLNTWQPEMLVVYASMARVLADEQLAGRLRIGPDAVFTSSEVLTTETRRRIEAAWGQQPFNQYAATETGGVAAECIQHRGMHLQEDLMFVEVVDERDLPVPPGEYGAKALVSVFASRTQPLIRYELTDSLRLATAPCPCGRPFALVDSVQGRVEDVLHLPAVVDGEIAVQPLLFSEILDTLPVGGWQVVQEANGGLTVLLSGVADGFAEQTVREEVAAALARQGAYVPAIEVRQVATIPKTAAGKVPLIRAARPATVDSGLLLQT